MNTVQLGAFLAVADTLSFARAAERLHVTQPSVTYQIRSLESELGVSLVSRSTRSVRLTNEGKVFLADAEAIMSTVERAAARFSARGSASSPVHLVVGCRGFAHASLLVGPLSTMAQSHPNLHPDLRVVPYEHLHQLLGDEQVDVVLDFEDTGSRAERYHRLMTVKAVLLCPEGNPLCKRSTARQEDLDGLALALNHPQHVPSKLRSVFYQLANRRPEALQHICDSTEAAIMLVQSGIAVSVQPSISVPADLPGIAVVPFEGVSTATFGAYTLGSANKLTQELIGLLRSAPHHGGVEPGQSGERTSGCQQRHSQALGEGAV